MTGVEKVGVSIREKVWFEPNLFQYNNNNNNNTHMSKPVCEKGDVTVLWNRAVHTDREVTANRPHIIIKNKK